MKEGKFIKEIDGLAEYEKAKYTNLKKKFEKKRKLVEKCYQDLIKPYYNEKLDIIDVSFMSKEEFEEFNNKCNCLLVQKYCYEEVLKA